MTRGSVFNTTVYSSIERIENILNMIPRFKFLDAGKKALREKRRGVQANIKKRIQKDMERLSDRG